MSKNKHTIMFLTHEDDKYGAAQSFLSIIKNLDRTIYEPVLISCKRNRYNQECKKLNIKNYVIPYVRCSTDKNTYVLRFLLKRIRRNIVNKFAVRSLIRIASKESVELVHTNTSVIDVGMCLSEKLNLPHVWHIREFLDKDFSQVFYSKDQINRMNSSNSYIIYISEAIADHWKSKGVSCQGEIIYNGINTKLYSKRKIQNDDIVKLIFSGHITPSKGQVQLIKAIHVLDKAGTDNIIVDIFGTGDESYLNFLKDLVDNYNLTERITFKGFSTELIKKLSNYDIGVVCSRAEGFGRVTVEYMLSGLAVIASNTGANPEIINDGKNGLLYIHGDIDSLAHKILFLAENRAERNRIAENGYKLAVRRFDEKQYLYKCYSIYQRLLNEN